MKKSIILTAAVALVLLSGCVQQEGLTGFEQSNYRISLSTDNSVLVDASISEGAQTRASYDTIIDVAKNIGIYCLPEKQLIQSWVGINWEKVITENDETTVGGIYWDNINCKVGDPFGENDEYHKLEFAGARPLYEYYPMVSAYAYKFYGYAPYQAGDIDNQENTFKYSADAIYVNYEMDGVKDILWGESAKATGTNAEWAYSGAYFRKNQKSPEVAINFEHMLTKLHFYIVPKPNFKTDDRGTNRYDYESVDSLQLKSIKILEVPDSVTLKVAAKDETAGQLVQCGTDLTSYTLRKNVAKENGVDDILSEITINNGNEIKADSIPVGLPHGKNKCSYIMAMPAAKYKIEIVLRGEKTGIEYTNELEITPRTKENPKALFEAGKYYDIKLGITGPVEISLISASILEWEEGDDVEVDFDNVPDPQQ